MGKERIVSEMIGDCLQSDIFEIFCDKLKEAMDVIDALYGKETTGFHSYSESLPDLIGTAVSFSRDPEKPFRFFRKEEIGRSMEALDTSCLRSCKDYFMETKEKFLKDDKISDYKRRDLMVSLFNDLCEAMDDLRILGTTYAKLIGQEISPIIKLSEDDLMDRNIGRMSMLCIDLKQDPEIEEEENEEKGEDN